MLRIAILCGLTSVTTTNLLQSQVLSSPNHVVKSYSSGNGGKAATALYDLVGAVGPVPGGATAGTAAYRLTGGFLPALAATAGVPMLSAVSPRYTTLLGQDTLTIYGTDLDVGPSPTIEIGGRPAGLVSRQKHRITTVAPVLSEPGWNSVVVRNSAGTAALTSGIGVLPMIEADSAPASDVPFSLVFRGTQGDTVFWALGFGPAPPITFPSIHYGFALTPSAFVVVGTVGINQASGELRMPFPATTYLTGTVYAQAMFSTGNPGYGPASFSNVIRM